MISPKPLQIALTLICIFFSTHVANCQEDALKRIKDSEPYREIKDSLKSINSRKNLPLIDSATLHLKANSLVQKHVSFDINDTLKAFLVQDSVYILNEVNYQKLQGHIDTLAHLKEVDSAYLPEQLTAFVKNNVDTKAIGIQNQEIQQFEQLKSQLDTGNTELLEHFVQNELSKREEFKALQDIPTFDNYRSKFPFQDPENFKVDKAAVSKTAAMAKLMTTQNEQVQESMKKVGKLKKRFTNFQLGDSANEIKERILPKKRWNLNLNLETQFRPHFKLESAPGVSYNFSNKWLAGIGTAFTYSYFYQDTSFHQFNDEVAFRAFSQYKFYKNIFAQLEYEQPYHQKEIKQEKLFESFQRVSPNVWIGAGVEYRFYKDLKAQTQILYNINSPQIPNENYQKWSLRVNFIY